MERAFYISTGYDPYNHEGKFLKFLFDCFGKSIQYYCTPSVQDLVNMGEKVKAIKMYREENNCTLVEAKNAVDNMCSDAKEDK